MGNPTHAHKMKKSHLGIAPLKGGSKLLRRKEDLGVSPVVAAKRANSEALVVPHYKNPIDTSRLALAIAYGYRRGVLVE